MNPALGKKVTGGAIWRGKQASKLRYVHKSHNQAKDSKRDCNKELLLGTHVKKGAERPSIEPGEGSYEFPRKWVAKRVKHLMMTARG